MKIYHRNMSQNLGIFNFRQFQIFLHATAFHFHFFSSHTDQFSPNFDNFFDTNPIIKFDIFTSAKIKRRSRGCGAFQATARPRTDGGEHRIPRHFNILAYGWIFGPL